MPPLPKKKRTQTRKRKRWSHSNLSPVTISTCPQCRAPKLPHHICPTCGFYAGREIISVAQGERGQEA
ncbi:MAG: 50S ribosomal protein L32 [Dehalococcoidia bacterium]